MPSRRLHPTPRAEEGARKREAILAAALGLFAERGFHGTAVPPIAEQAGVGTGTIYRYFESKEDLVNALYQEWKQKLGDALLTDFPAEAAPREQFRAFWQRSVAFARENPTAFLFLEMHHHAAYLDAKSRALEERVLMPVAMAIQAAQAKGAMKPVAAEAVIALTWGALVGLVKAEAQGFLQLDDATLEQAEECCWSGVSA